MGYELDKLKRLYGVGTANIASFGGQTLGAPPAETASAADKAAFEDQLRKYQIDQRAYKAYTDEYANRLANTNMYAQPQFNTNPNTATPPAPRTPLNPITYGAIPANVSAATDQGAMYKQMRDVGYTDADIRAATSKITGSPNEQKWSEMLNVAYPQYQPMITSAYQQLGRSGFGADPAQIDYGGYNYWLNQLSSGAVKPEDLNKAVLTAGTVTTNPGTGTVTTGPNTGAVTTTPPIYGDINQIYQQYFNRPAEQEGLNYWAQSGFTGDTLKNAIIAGAQGPDLAYYQQNFMQSPDPYYAGGPGEGGGAARGGYISKYAEGGQVRRHYQTGGMADEGNLDELDAFYRDPRNFTRPTPSVAPPNEIRVDVTAPAPEPAAETPPPSSQQGSGRSRLDDIFNRYYPTTGVNRELAEARRRSQSESEAFYNLIRQMAERGESPTSRSEMYFRLASAFGAPTRTGSMGETLSKVGEQMGEYTKGRRSEEAERRNLMLRAQEARMAGAREDLATTRALAAQESAERRSLLGKILEEEIRANRPTERQQRIAEIMTTYNVDRETAMNIVNNIETTMPNPVTGETMRYNRITRQLEPVAVTGGATPAAPAAAAPAAPVAPAAAPSGAGRPESAQPPRTLWEMAPRVTGAVPALAETVQGITGQAGVNVAPEGLIRDRQTFAAVQNDLIRALSVNPRFPVAEMQRIEREIAISPGVFTDPVSMRERMASVDTYLRGRLQNEDRAANDASLPVDTRRAALSAANSIRDFLAQLGVPEGGGTSRSNQPAATQRNRPQAPRVGTVVDGYRFLGGDPSDQSNWSRE